MWICGRIILLFLRNIERIDRAFFFPQITHGKLFFLMMFSVSWWLFGILLIIDNDEIILSLCYNEELSVCIEWGFLAYLFFYYICFLLWNFCLDSFRWISSFEQKSVLYDSYIFFSLSHTLSLFSISLSPSPLSLSPLSLSLSLSLSLPISPYLSLSLSLIIIGQNRAIT